MSNLKELPPDPRTPFTGLGESGWRDWFQRGVWTFLQGVCKTKADVEALDIDIDGGTA